jgi:cytochrome c-type biogenesis protein CcmH/NrfG
VAPAGRQAAVPHEVRVQGGPAALLDHAAGLLAREPPPDEHTLRSVAHAVAWVVDDTPGDLRARRILGDIYHRLGEFDAAIEQYGQALRLLRERDARRTGS